VCGVLQCEHRSRACSKRHLPVLPCFLGTGNSEFGSPSAVGDPGSHSVGTWRSSPLACQAPRPAISPPTAVRLVMFSMDSHAGRAVKYAAPNDEVACRNRHIFGDHVHYWHLISEFAIRPLRIRSPSAMHAPAFVRLQSAGMATLQQKPQGPAGPGPGPVVLHQVQLGVGSVGYAASHALQDWLSACASYHNGFSFGCLSSQIATPWRARSRCYYAS
jgi:hypothetical protein